ncbi:hypothetical protein RchiOBHm_Chr2g0117151 [Rosa chinensis]|uniref:Uncharacterized protein n=1 Tax=Rosa chinensis TaxID=74649 RepID=A0A2P6RRF4_ROSCH|nr:hypothetical protein RchiOBHm_Chr2g0117151 [Rosa chinensis]
MMFNGICQKLLELKPRMPRGIFCINFMMHKLFFIIQEYNKMLKPSHVSQ